jgi:hypothetical protein
VEMDKAVKIYTLEAPIELNSLVVRAWKTDPKCQYEIGAVIGVYDGDDYHLHGDIMVQWANGAVRNELCCELQHIRLEDAD